MPVYMIQSQSPHSPVKIGHSHDPEIRLGQLQVSHWEELRIIRLFEGGEAEEATLHLRFADLYIRGEWHNFSRAMLGDVGLVEITPQEEQFPEYDTPAEPVVDSHPVGCGLRQWLAANRMTQADVAKKCSINHAVFSRFVLGQRRTPAGVAVKISQAVGIPLSVMRPDLWAASADQAA